MSIESYYTQINRYRELKSHLINVVNNLNNAKSNIDQTKSNLESSYTIDDNPTPIAEKCNSLSLDIIKTSETLSNKVIPAIDSAILSTKNQIQALEAEQ